MKLSTLEYRNYRAIITNLSTMEEIQDWVEECNITLPQSKTISSMEAKFQLEAKKINQGNEIKIEVLDEVGNVLYTMQGKANIPKRTKSHTGIEIWEYSIKDSYEKLFEKVIAESETYYDLYLCNTEDQENSLLHKIANALGFRKDEMDFADVTYENGELIRIPFVYLEENARWIDKLQAFMEATDGILYIKNKKLFFRPRNLAINNSFSFDVNSVKATIEESEKEVLQNGIKVVYDRFEKLENQVVFNLSKKIITEANTNQDTDVPTMRIKFITSAVSNPTLTKATGYYFTSDDPKSKVDIALEENVHYKKISWKETGAEIKLYNPLPQKLYIDNFEIKGVPLSMFENNEVNVMFSDILEKRQENFISSNKNKFVQTRKQAEFLAKKEMQRSIVNKKEYHFKSPFLHQIEVGGVYSLDLEDIHTVIEVTNISINLKPSLFTMDIQAKSVKNKLEKVRITSKMAGNPKENYVDLKPLEEELKKQDGELKKLDRDIRSKLHKTIKMPTENVEENDIWLNPDTNEWKKFYNGVWNPISEKEILPSMKMYNSLDGNVVKLQGTADKVGAYLLNDGEKFGSLNGDLAHTTFDKLGQFEAVNPNNKVALNIKDPANPSRVTSQILLGVTDINDSRWSDTVFAIGDEASSNRLEYKNGNLVQTVNGEELGTTLDTVQGALENGNFVITGNTTFDGSARFVSRGTNEVITIADGSIDFHRNGQRLTRIKNIRYGTIATDSKGKGVVNFVGFEQPMLVLPSVKSANFGKNMASIFCYAEHIRDCQYRFYVGGTNEHWKEATPVKVVGTEWRADNVFESSLLQIEIKPKFFINERVGNWKEITKYPYFQFSIYQQENNGDSILLSQKKIKLDMELTSRHYSVPDKIYRFEFNFTKRYKNRTSVRFFVQISFISKNIKLKHRISGRELPREIPEFVISQAITNITASASISTLGEVTGNGEVQYIAMEID